MPLPPGARLGVYEVTASIGSGGMGEVYRARDTRLKRDVALKILPDVFASDPERLARFQREAEVLASLNHPNIATIHGLEESDGVHALVMELVEGPTLAECIESASLFPGTGERVGAPAAAVTSESASRGAAARGGGVPRAVRKASLPLDEALPIAKQIAEALEVAHEQGIIHRDLKPANIKVRPDGTVKVLDFGLAKLSEPSGSSAVAQGFSPAGGLSQSPTITSPAAMTMQGVILGTAAYMSPEQAKGKPVDKRADIWAFGCVLYEMLTGRRVFGGEDVTDVLASVVAREPDLSALDPSLPAPLRRLLTRCLDKDPRRRLRDIGDARWELEQAEASARPAGPDHLMGRPWQHRFVPVAVTALLAATVLTIWSLTAARSAQDRPPTRFLITLPPGVSLPAQPDGVAISPNGRDIVFAATPGDGRRLLFHRRLDELDAVPMTGSEDARTPFFSPDGAWVGFFTGDSLKKVALDGRPPVTICAITGARRGAAWAADDTIVFRTSTSPELFRVSAAGGAPQAVGVPPAGDGYDWIDLLPDGQAALVTLFTGLDTAQIGVLSLETGEMQPLLGGNFPRYVASGHLVYWRQGSLWAAPFSAANRRLTGEPAPVVAGVGANTGGQVHFDVADDGTLIYLPEGFAVAARRTLVLVDREGREELVEGLAPGDYAHVRISPDGTRLAVSRGLPARDVWIHDLRRGTTARVTTDPASDDSPIWTPDGQRIVFTSDRDGYGSPTLYWQRSDGTGEAERLLTLGEGSVSYLQADDWSPDGRRLLFTTVPVAAGAGDIGIVSLDDDRRVEMLTESEFREGQAAISPDGNWMAYHSNRSGQFEIYVERFPDLGDRQRVSIRGGRAPRWSPDGTTLFHLSLDGSQTWAVPIIGGPTLAWETPRILLEGSYLPPESINRPYDIAPDSQRFVVVKLGAAAGTPEAWPQLVVVRDWFSELTRLVPVD